MELCGPYLRSWLKQVAEQEGELDDRMHWKIFSHIVKGLRHIHKNNIIHRDLKPENIFVCGDYVKIGDLGLARLMPRTRATYQNMSLVGTPCYMAPEQNTPKYDKSVDIYSLELILAELFCSVKPQKLIIYILSLQAGIVSPNICRQWPKIALLISNMVKDDPKERIDLVDISELCKSIKRELCRHDYVSCNGCNMLPMRGVRFKCEDCPEFDLCEHCKETEEHDPEHSFSPMNEIDSKFYNILLNLGTGRHREEEINGNSSDTDTDFTKFEIVDMGMVSVSSDIRTIVLLDILSRATENN